jgi:UDP-N-acetyl-D-glucosamine dehydrogenase
VAIDNDLSRVERLRRGDSYADDIGDAQLRAAFGTGRFSVSADYADSAWFAVAVIAVPTPLRDRSPDLSLVAQAGVTLRAT